MQYKKTHFFIVPVVPLNVAFSWVLCEIEIELSYIVVWINFTEFNAVLSKKFCGFCQVRNFYSTILLG